MDVQRGPGDMFRPTWSGGAERLSQAHGPSPWSARLLQPPFPCPPSILTSQTEASKWTGRPDGLEAPDAIAETEYIEDSERVDVDRDIYVFLCLNVLATSLPAREQDWPFTWLQLNLHSHTRLSTNNLFALVQKQVNGQENKAPGNQMRHLASRAWNLASSSMSIYSLLTFFFLSWSSINLN